MTQFQKGTIYKIGNGIPTDLESLKLWAIKLRVADQVGDNLKSRPAISTLFFKSSHTPVFFDTMSVPFKFWNEFVAAEHVLALRFNPILHSQHQDSFFITFENLIVADVLAILCRIKLHSCPCIIPAFLFESCQPIFHSLAVVNE